MNHRQGDMEGDVARSEALYVSLTKGSEELLQEQGESAPRAVKKLPIVLAPLAAQFQYTQSRIKARERRTA